LAHEHVRRESRPKDGDKRFGAEHKRYSRSFVRIQHADREIVFFPIKEWPSTVHVTQMTLRNWLNKGVIAARRVYDMHVMCRAEMHALRDVVKKWHSTRDLHNALEPEFRAEMREALAEVRLALDTYRRQLPVSDRQLALLRPSF
jgi:hypothetical protein